ncbi:hypothetical protein [Peterkaempfera bronchialis]|uniref:Secreted protein n=1 Tax=Peterkaempfera bronchialis TaxID=2126346 RepID=A0A345SYZ3_9ACTN|nr:hypothetical protein [Peterkaempfera bronchialis]AXI78948.1 hypothetical protein C7M71_017550 [Peterkaempfera bronchialis]
MKILSRAGGRALAAAGAAVIGALGAQAPASAAEARPAKPAQAPEAALRPVDTAAAFGTLGSTAGTALRPVTDLRLDPWANSSADPLTNGVAVQPKTPNGHTGQLSTLPLTAPLSGGGGLKDVPVVGQVVGLLRH